MIIVITEKKTKQEKYTKLMIGRNFTETHHHHHPNPQQQNKDKQYIIIICNLNNIIL